MSDKKKSDVKQPGWLRKVWLWVKRWWLPIVILLITSAGLVCALSIPQRVFETPSNLNDRDTSTSQNPGTPDNKETSHTIQSPSNSNNRNAPVLLAQSNLRLAFLYITGGAIAVMGLIETFRKNNNEKLKNDQEKEKNDRDHLRQVRAGRRERYTKAVEQLGDEKAPIRMGGVYTLVGLVDEWLEDESIEKYEDRLKEGQVIINNLCAYIRSPFTLATRYDELSKDSPSSDGIYKDNQQEFYTDKAEFKAEADVRLGIIKEIHDRLQGYGKNAPGAWSDFEYDFSGSTFFYPIDLTNSYYAKPINFSGSTYQGWAYFSRSTYEGWANFSRSTYEGGTGFSGSTYEGGTGFSGSTYEGWANFSGSTYEGWTGFSGSTYQGEANFSGSTYQGKADFSGSIFYQKVYFGADGDNGSFSRFISCTPQFYDETNRKNTLFGSPNNDFTVENGRGYPIYRNFEGLPLGCKFLTSEQKEYLEGKLQEIEKINNKLREVKDTEEKDNLIKTLLSFYYDISNWHWEAVTVKVEDVAAEDTES